MGNIGEYKHNEELGIVAQYLIGHGKALVDALGTQLYFVSVGNEVGIEDERGDLVYRTRQGESPKKCTLRVFDNIVEAVKFARSIELQGDDGDKSQPSEVRVEDIGEGIVLHDHISYYNQLVEKIDKLIG